MRSTLVRRIIGVLLWRCDDGGMEVYVVCGRLIIEFSGVLADLDFVRVGCLSTLSFLFNTI
jgi:hypothetical protein